MATIRRGGQIQSKLQFLIYGNKGTWKSSLALEFAKMRNEKDEPMKVLYIDTEKNSIDDYVNNLRDEGLNVDNDLLVVKTREFKETLEIIEAARKTTEKVPFGIYVENENGQRVIERIYNEDGSNWIPDAIVIDSISTLYDQLITGLTSLSQRRAAIKANKAGITGEEKTLNVELAGIEIKDYNVIKEKGKELVLALLASGKHFALIAKEDELKETAKDDDNKFNTVGTGVKVPMGFKQIGYDVKTVLHTINDNGTIYAIVEDKDRTGVKKQNERIEHPTLLDWEEVIKKNVGKKQEVIINDSKESVKNEVKGLQETIVANTGEDVISTKDYDQDLNSLRNEIVSLISRTISQGKGAPLKTAVKENNFPTDVTHADDVEQLTKMLSFIKDFCTKNNIH